MSRRGVVAAATVAIASLALAACSSSSSLSGSGTSSSAAGGGSIVVGSANFPENEILAEIYGQALAAKGFTVSYKLNIGARAAYFAALKKGEINLIPEYAGAILSFLDDTANEKSGDAVKSALTAALPSGLKALDLSEAADSDSLNVTPAYAKANSLSSIADLAKLKSFTLAANPEFKTRPDGIPGLKSVYGIDNVTFKAISDGGGPATLKALLNDTVQVADIYSTTPSILENGLVTLKDPKNLFASQQVVPIVTASKATSTLQQVVNRVSATLTTADLLALNKEVTGSAKTDPAVAAKNWLTEKSLL